MKCILSSAKVYLKGRLEPVDILVDGGIITDISHSLTPETGANILNFNNCFIFPGLVDVHVHLREPGFLEKETIRSGTLAAAHGGFTSICSMPNLSPVPDSVENLAVQISAIKKDAMINVYPYGALTVSELGEIPADLEGMASEVVAFSDDGKGVQSDEMMRSLMKRAKALDKIIAAHCEDESLLTGGYIHDGIYAKLNSHHGICSASEYKQIERDIALVRETGCKYHVCHISTKESVELIRYAKKEGLDITCETAPHYLVLNDMCIIEDGRFKMNPPIRTEEDRLALLDGILDGTIDMIATDHAPHTKEQKSKGLKNSAMGVVGLETAFAICYTSLVKSKLITLEKLIELMHTNPSKRFGIGTEIDIGAPADLTIFDLEAQYIIDTNGFLSKGRATPFEGREVFGKCKMTMVNGRVIWQDNSTGN